METLLSLGLGGILRLAPEVLDFFDRKSRRSHEAKMVDAGIYGEYIKASGSAFVEAVKAQGVLTGVKIADALNILVRPIITYWWVIVLYSAYLISAFIVLLDSGENYHIAVVSLFGDNEKALVNTIVSFWFVDRVLKYKGVKHGGG